MKNLALLLSLALLGACPDPKPAADLALAPDQAAGVSLILKNATSSATTVNFAFGADSVVLPAAWPACVASAALNCALPLGAMSQVALPASGYLNTTLAFGSLVGCGSTKAEINMNNPTWFNTLDVSLVDGYSNNITIESEGQKLGPPLGATGNEKVLGLFPVGCDICVARQSPPCGQSPGGTGCKMGPDQYHPDVPCQVQGAIKFGGVDVTVSLVP